MTNGLFTEMGPLGSPEMRRLDKDGARSGILCGSELAKESCAILVNDLDLES